MTVREARDLLGTSSAEFLANGSLWPFVNWLDQARPDISRSRCRQLGYHARKLLDTLGAEVAELVVGDPENVVARLREIDLERAGVASSHRWHMNRAARALHAWLHDLDPEATAMVMDRTTRPDRQASVAAGYDADGQDLLTGVSPMAATVNGANAGLSADEAETEEAGIDPEWIVAEMPASYRFFEDTVCSQVSLAFGYNETVPDIRAFGRHVLAQHTPATRRRIAFDIARVGEIDLDVRDLSHVSLTDICDEAILRTLENRGVEIRDEPLGTA